MEGKSLGYGGDEEKIMSVDYPCGSVKFSSLGSFSSFGSSYKPSCYSFPLYIGS